MTTTSINFETFKINDHDIEEMKKFGISEDMIMDVVEEINALKAFIENDNKEMAKRVLSKLHRHVVTIVRKMDYDFELELELEELSLYLVKFIRALISRNEFDINFERIGFENKLLQFEQAHPDFEW